MDLALEYFKDFSEVRVAPRDQENITEFVFIMTKILQHVQLLRND